MLTALAWGAAIGGALVLGALAGAFLPMWERTATTFTVFGGILLGALAFEVVPSAEEHAGAITTALGVLGDVFGGIGLALVAAIVVGSTLLTDAGDAVIGLAQAVAGGAIFATVSIAIIPHGFAEVSRWAAVVGVLGLVAGYLLA